MIKIISWQNSLPFTQFYQNISSKHFGTSLELWDRSIVKWNLEYVIYSTHLSTSDTRFIKTYKLWDIYCKIKSVHFFSFNHGIINNIYIFYDITVTSKQIWISRNIKLALQRLSIKNFLSLSNLNYFRQNGLIFLIEQPTAFVHP